MNGKNLFKSKRLYSLNIEILSQKNGSVPLANAKSKYQLRGTLPSEINISDLVQNINIYNYDTQQHQKYNESDIKYSMQESENNISNL